MPEHALGFEFAVVRRGPSESSLEDYLDLLRRHIELLPLFELVRIDAENEETVYIWVRPCTEDRAGIEKSLRGSLKARALEFRLLAEPSPGDPGKYERFRRQLQEKGPEPNASDEYGWFVIDDLVTFFDLETPAELQSFDVRNARHVVEKHGDHYYVLAKLSGEDGLLADEEAWFIRIAYADRDQVGRRCVSFELDETGGRLLTDLTRRNFGRALCILVDERAIAAPTIQTVIGKYGQVTGNFSREKVSDLLSALQANAGPFRLKFVGRID